MKDPRESDINVRRTQAEVFVSSMGADGIADTHDDIQVPRIVEAESASGT